MARKQTEQVIHSGGFLLKLVYLIGLPGCGKTTVMKKLMSKFSDWKQDRPVDLLDTHVSGNIRILGKYIEGETFSGTDTLSMAVAPKAIEFFSSSPNEIVIGEGDRLNSSKVFDSVQDKLIIHLTVSDSEREERYKKRGSNQPEKFIQTVRTKCKNICEKYGNRSTLFGEEEGCLVEFVHETESDTDKIVEYIYNIIRNTK